MPPVRVSLSKASTFQEYSFAVVYTAPLAKLTAGDMIAQEAKYHAKCLVSLYNKACEVATSDEREVECDYHGIALGGLI